MFYYSDHFDALKALLVALPEWRTWIGSEDDGVIGDRISWPWRATSLTDYPYINMSPGAGRLANATGNFGSSANYRYSGSLWLRLWDADSDLNDPTASFESFDGLASGMLSALMQASASGPLILMQATGDEPVIVHSHDNAEYVAQSSDSDPVWHSSVQLAWGLL